MKPRCRIRHTSPGLRGTTQRSCLLLGLAFLILTSPASAQTDVDCLVGPGLGATLLVPYFEVDLDNPSGLTTIISVNNGLDSETMARVTLWTDWGVPTFGFDLYIPDFGVVPINMRDVMAGRVPSTGDGSNLRDFDNCETTPPVYPNPLLSSTDRDQLRADHTGVLGPRFSSCAGNNNGDNIARGYITIDSTGSCIPAEIDPEVTPEAGRYFKEGGLGLANNDNRLWGDVIYIDPVNNSAQGSEAIALWADAERFNGTNRPTFYGRLRSFDAKDDRVPLPTLWNQRFLNGGPFQGGADLIVFRNPQTSIATAECGSKPPQIPLDAQLKALDESGDNLVNVSITGLLGLVTQRTAVDDFNIPYDAGWLQLDSTLGAWVQPTLSAGSLFSAAFNGTSSGGFQCDNIGATDGEGDNADSGPTARVARSRR